MRISSFIVIALLCFTRLFADNQKTIFQILPQPQSVKMIGGDAFMYTELKYIEANPTSQLPILGSMLDHLPQIQQAGRGVYLELTDKNVPASPEGYVLEIRKNGVVIKARQEAGLFYGCQTLEQLLEDSRDFNRAIPQMIITDYPAIGYRAIHLDTKHHLDAMNYYYDMVDKLARYKINAIIWEVEDKLRYTRRPEIAAPNAISKQEMQALSRYAKARHVEISPLVQGLGHAGFILKHHRSEERRVGKEC